MERQQCPYHKCPTWCARLSRHGTIRSYCILRVNLCSGFVRQLFDFGLSSPCVFNRSHPILILGCAAEAQVFQLCKTLPHHLETKKGVRINASCCTDCVHKRGRDAKLAPRLLHRPLRNTHIWIESLPKEDLTTWSLQGTKNLMQFSEGVIAAESKRLA